jgi:L-ascorbate metabolism protein UlaG (beta-lactamase superfamily)
MKRILKYMLMSLFLIVCCLALGACFFLNQPKFGGSPEGDRLNTIQKSSNYADGEFQNLITTPKFTKDVSTFSILRDNLLNPKERLVPDGPIPVVKTDLMNLDRMTDAVVWLGHSSYFIQLSGKRILLDPVFSDHAAPLSFLNKAFTGTNIYRADDMPGIDFLLISHDHWDHLDYSTVVALKDKVSHVVCPLGVGAYFEDWGYEPEKIHEADWYDQVELEGGFTVHVLPARHYSGRLLRQNKTLWAGFALESSKQRLFFSGDSGYGSHFAEIGRRFGDFDLVALDCGQYDDRWAYIHMTPEEAAQAARDLGARALIPAHVGRFTIANHPWDEPFKRLKEASQDKSYRLLTPKIGEPVALNDILSQFSHWWEAEEFNL